MHACLPNAFNQSGKELERVLLHLAVRAFAPKAKPNGNPNFPRSLEDGPYYELLRLMPDPPDGRRFGSIAIILH